MDKFAKIIQKLQELAPVVWKQTVQAQVFEGFTMVFTSGLFLTFCVFGVYYLLKNGTEAAQFIGITIASLVIIVLTIVFFGGLSHMLFPTHHAVLEFI